MTRGDGSNPWVKRYTDVASHAEIRRRAQLLGRPVVGLDSDLVEVACKRMSDALGEVFVVTVQCCHIIGREIERAIAYAQSAYPTRQEVLKNAYTPPTVRDMANPICITGLAGGGKSSLEDALSRVLGGLSEIDVDPDHGPFSQSGYTSVLVKGQLSISRFLRPLAKPEIASGEVRVAEPEMPYQCASWLYKTGTCLFGIDELQFMSQSSSASTMVSKALLACGHIGVPWHYIANYSLCWKLKRRPQEATQRLLSQPTVLFPDPPDSKDWSAVLAEFQVVIGEYFAFALPDRAIELWNLSAGLKRELKSLLVHSYRLSRLRGSKKVEWTDVQMAFASDWFSASREDIDLLIQYAAQGGELPEDLRCPFVGSAISIAANSYEKSLRDARASKVAAAVLDSSMTDPERKAAKSIAKMLDPESSRKKKAAVVVQLPAKRGRTLESLQEAGRRFKDERDPEAP